MVMKERHHCAASGTITHT